MGQAQILAEITGTTPLLMHKFPDPGTAENIMKKPIQEQAELAAYRENDTDQLFVPAENVKRAIINGAAYTKYKGNITYVKVAAGCVFVFGNENPERLYLGRTEYEIDQRTVVNGNVGKGVRIWCYRPRFDEWRLDFTLEYDDDLITDSTLNKILTDTGRLIGIGPFRPEKKGPMGRFIISKWEKIVYNSEEAAG